MWALYSYLRIDVSAVAELDFAQLTVLVNAKPT
jgi:hypothetical protein